MPEIPIYNKGEIVSYSKIDDDLLLEVNKVIWYLKRGYAHNHKLGLLHRFIMKANKGDSLIDHINGDKLDNRKVNLRFASQSQNSQNKPKKQGTKFKYIGVSYNEKMNKWCCHVKIDGLRKSFSFIHEEHAAYWYDKYALINYGKDAKINNITMPNDFVEPDVNVRNLPKGISLTKNNTYQAELSKKYLGTFKTLEEAQNARNNAIKELEEKKNNKLLSVEILRNVDGIAVIKTNKGNEILVDDDKYYELMKYKWTFLRGYAVSCINKKMILMHRFLLNAKDGEIIDHVNKNRSDNRMSNLRICDDKLNAHNKTKLKGTSSKYIGVCFSKNANKYEAYINFNKKKYHLGLFGNEIEAAKAYNKKATEFYGQNANLNTI